jgi:ABC-type branched-subunit amino acid transport system ATPase component/predicted MFS family arabinose efflux permease
LIADQSRPETGAGDAAVLADALLPRDETRSDSTDDVLFADELLPGVGGEELTLRQGIAKGGLFTFLVLFMLNSLDELEAGAMSLLAPDIRDTFGVSDGTITFITASAAAFVVLGAFPLGYMADRYRRAPIIGVSTVLFSGFVFLSGLAVNAFTMFCARFGAGIAKANTGPVHGSLLADTYPISIRGRLSATNAMGSVAVGAVSPVLIGAIVLIAGGDEGWRWAFLVLGLPVGVIALVAFRLPEPMRGQWEKTAVVSTVIHDANPAPISIEAAFARLSRIKTLRSVLVAFSAIGFLIFTLSVQSNIYLEDEFGLDTFARGIVMSATGVAATCVLPFVGRSFDRRYRTDPESALRLIGLCLLPMAVLIPAQFLMPNVYLFVAFAIPVQVLFTASFSMVQPTVQAILPYRLRGLGMAIVTLYIFLVGAVGGAMIAALLIDAYGPRFAIIVLAVPSLAIGGGMLLRGASSIKHDLSLIVAELREELAEDERQRQDPNAIPAIQVADVDFSYGQVQVLFGLNFSVARGETLALLGTNGAGKTTILKVIAGLTTPQRGVVRLHGRTITYTTPEQRATMGIQMLPGGRGTFPALTVYDNLVVGAYQYRHDRADVERRINRVLETFPVLAEKVDQLASELSGGQQQTLALARVMLHDPDVLIIDELSLGLAPTVVQQLLDNIDRLKHQGQTMIIVEQSLNVALSVADRAVFLEKGQVRFEGSAKELKERDDLARAVFLGGEGG